jgi:hypothetical protein
LNPDPRERFQDVLDIQSGSAKAWYIVITSLESEAYQIAYPKERTLGFSQSGKRSYGDRWRILSETLQLTIDHLPAELAFDELILDFGTRTHGFTQTSLHSLSSIYLINMMPEIARLLALRPYLYEDYIKKLLKASRAGNRDVVPLEPQEQTSQCYRVADAILKIIEPSHGTHYRYVNPYIAHASWLAATVKLLQQYLEDDEVLKCEARMSFSFLKTTQDQFVDYWGMSGVPTQTLDILDTRMNRFAAGMITSGHCSSLSVHDCRFTAPGVLPPASSQLDSLECFDEPGIPSRLRWPLAMQRVNELEAILHEY